jgi:hypothetical protein
MIEARCICTIGKKMSVMQRQVKFVISISGRRLYAVKSQFRWVENEL